MGVMNITVSAPQDNSARSAKILFSCAPLQFLFACLETNKADSCEVWIWVEGYCTIASFMSMHGALKYARVLTNLKLTL